MKSVQKATKVKFNAYENKKQKKEQQTNVKHGREKLENNFIDGKKNKLLATNFFLKINASIQINRWFYLHNIKIKSIYEMIQARIM